MGEAALSLLHLTRRFFESLVPGGPAAEDEAWARGHLRPAEARLWDAMSPVDRRHAVAVARAVEDDLAARATPPVVVAALLHDVGKTEAGLGTVARAVAAAVGLAGGRGLTRRQRRYLDYPRRGAERLRTAGADDLVVAWAAEHHRPPEAWTVPRDVGDALARADRRAR